MTDEEMLALATEAASKTLEACRGFDWSGVHGLESQLQRAAVSVPSNITEGIGRAHSGEGSRKSKIRFYLIAYGSLRECVVQLELLRRQKPQSGDLVLALMSEWSAVRRELLAIVDGVLPAEDRGVQRAFAHHRMVSPSFRLSEQVRSSLEEFVSQAKESIEALPVFPVRTQAGEVFSLKAFRNFLRNRNLDVRPYRLTSELRKLGWAGTARRYGVKVFRVWVRGETLTKWVE